MVDFGPKIKVGFGQVTSRFLKLFAMKKMWI